MTDDRTGPIRTHARIQEHPRRPGTFRWVCHEHAISSAGRWSDDRPLVQKMAERHDLRPHVTPTKLQQLRNRGADPMSPVNDAPPATESESESELRQALNCLWGELTATQLRELPTEVIDLCRRNHQIVDHAPTEPVQVAAAVAPWVSHETVLD